MGGHRRLVGTRLGSGGHAGLETELSGPPQIQVQHSGWSKLEKQLEMKSVRGVSW